MLYMEKGYRVFSNEELKELLTIIEHNIKTAKKEEELKRDAKRYRWLRAQHWSDGGMSVVLESRDLKLKAYCPSGINLDKVIDRNLVNS